MRLCTILLRLLAVEEGWYTTAAAAALLQEAAARRLRLGEELRPPEADGAAAARVEARAAAHAEPLRVRRAGEPARGRGAQEAALVRNVAVRRPADDVDAAP